jgi:hypothetical protein
MSEQEINTLVTETRSLSINQGTGGGGANTNVNGLSFEKKTDLSTEFEQIKETKDKSCKIIKFKNYRKRFILANKANLFKYMKNEMNTSIKKAHGCKQPDECYIDKSEKKMFIIEKKNQNVGGSVCEKIQTPGFKKRHYNKLFPTYDVEYIYVLSTWFFTNCEAEIEDAEEIGIPIFNGDDSNCKKDLIKLLCE